MPSSSSSVAKAKRGFISLQGPRPLPLSVPTTSPPRPSKRPRVVKGDDDDDVRATVPGPVIVYEHTPKVIHARPDEFKALVQRLTGRRQQTAGGGDQEAAVLRPSSQQEATTTAGDPLVLTLGQHHVLHPPLIADHHSMPPVLPPSPGGAGGFILSPGSFLFSPTTMQAIQELIS